MRWRWWGWEGIKFFYNTTIVMNSNIKDVVDNCPSIHLQINVGNRHRISHRKISRGSLWIGPHTNNYYVEVTGDIESYLYPFLHNKFGVHYGENQGKKFWYVKNFEDVESIIQYLNHCISGEYNSLTETEESKKSLPHLEPGLTETTPPKHSKKEKKERLLSSYKIELDYLRREFVNRELGLEGELLVFENECEKLKKAGREDLAKKIIHVSVVEGDGAGYDIRSFDYDGNTLYLEVKTTTGGQRTSFFLSANEKAFAASHPKSFRLVRVYDYDENQRAGNVFSLNTEDLNELTLTPTIYRVSF